MLAYLPRRRLFGDRERRAELVDAPVAVAELRVHEPHPLGHRADVSGGRLGGARGYAQGRLAQRALHRCRVELADTVLLQHTLDAGFADPPRFSRSRCQLPQGEEPVGRHVRRHIEHLRVVAPQLLPYPVAEPHLLLLQVLGHPRHLAQLDDPWIVDPQPPEAPLVGAQRVSENPRVPPVILRPGDGEPIAEAVELLGIDRVHDEFAFQQRLDHGAVRHLDRDMDLRRLRLRCLLQPTAELVEAVAAVGDDPFSYDLTRRIDQAHLVLLARPVDADVPSGFRFHLHHPPCFAG